MRDIVGVLSISAYLLSCDLITEEKIIVQENTTLITDTLFITLTDTVIDTVRYSDGNISYTAVQKYFDLESNRAEFGIGVAGITYNIGEDTLTDVKFRLILFDAVTYPQRLDILSDTEAYLSSTPPKEIWDQPMDTVYQMVPNERYFYKVLSDSFSRKDGYVPWEFYWMTSVSGESPD